MRAQASRTAKAIAGMARRNAGRAGALALIAALALPLAAASCGGDGDSEELVVYSGRSEPLVKPFLDEFAEREGIEVKTRYADTPDLVGTLIEEGDKTRADVFIAQDAAAMEQLRRRNLLQPYDGLKRTPRRYRAEDGSWTGVSGRARVLIVREGTPHPDSVFDLTDPRWRDRVVAPDPTNASFRDWVSAIRVRRGDGLTRRYLDGLKANGLETLAGHSEVRKAVAKGEFDIGLVNHYYVELEKQEGSNVEAVYTDQEPEGFGVVFNLASAGIVRSASNAGAARKLMDYLLTPEVQERFARENFEYPLLPGLSVAPGVRPLKDVRTTDVTYTQLGAAVPGTDRLLERVDLGR